jgi:hypothetical protein
MTSTSISDNKPHLNKDLIKLAVSGTDDYHYLMTAIVHQSLMSKAGYIPDKLDEPPPNKNPEHWQTKKQHMNAGNLWIFFATEYGHYSNGEARIIWRYGQLQLIKPHVIRRIRQSVQHPDVLIDTLNYCWTNPIEFTREPDDDELWFVHAHQRKCSNYLTKMQNKHSDWTNYPNFGSAWSAMLLYGIDYVYGGTTFKTLNGCKRTLYEHLENERREWSLV